MTTRDAIIRIAKTAVDALRTMTRMKCRNGSGQRIASELTSTLARMAASVAQAMPAAARIRPNCK